MRTHRNKMNRQNKYILKTAPISYSRHFQYLYSLKFYIAVIFFLLLQSLISLIITFVIKRCYLCYFYLYNSQSLELTRRDKKYFDICIVFSQLHNTFCKFFSSCLMQISCCVYIFREYAFSTIARSVARPINIHPLRILNKSHPRQSARKVSSTSKDSCHA